MQAMVLLSYSFCDVNILGQLLPILVGTDIKDPAGSGHDVPILCIDKEKFTGNIKPVGGTMEEPNGAGLIPIVIGANAIDPASGNYE